MSKRSYNNKIQQQGIDELQFEQEEEDLNEEDEEIIQKLIDYFGENSTRKEIVRIYIQNEYDGDVTADILDQKILNRQKLKLSKKSTSEIVQTQQQKQLQGQHQNQPNKDQPNHPECVVDVPKRKKSSISGSQQDISPISGGQFGKSNSIRRKLSKKISEDLTNNEEQKQPTKPLENIKLEINLKKFNSPYPAIQPIIEEEYQANKVLPHLNLVIVGHVDSGKSTLIGHLMHLKNLIDQKLIHKNEKDSKAIGKESFKYAWVNDELEAERQRGVTMDIGFKWLITKQKSIQILDSPGHKDFVPKMISGATQADYALLVIDSYTGCFESGFGLGGQTKEHAYLIRAFGVRNVIVGVNKMDLNQWSLERYQFIENQLLDFLQQIGFNKTQIIFIPLSAFKGENIISAIDSKDASWYKGPCLLDLLDNLEVPPRDNNKPARFNIYNHYVGKTKGICLSGKMEGGIIERGKKYIIMPQQITCTIKGKFSSVNTDLFKEILNKEIHIDGEKTKYGKIGQNLDVQILPANDHDIQSVNSGNVLCPFDYPIPITKIVIAEFLAFDVSYPILKGTQVIVYINTAKAPGLMKKINKIINKSTGETMKKLPKSIKAGECAEIEIHFDELLCVELFSNFQAYGRVILREKNSTLGVGKIKEIK